MKSNFYNHNLRINLKEWRNRLIKANHDQFENAHHYFFDKIKSIPALFSFLAESPHIPSGELFDKIDFTYERPEWRFKDEEHEAVFKFYLMEYLLEKSDGTVVNWLSDLAGGKNYSELIINYIESYIDPIVNFLNDQLDHGSMILYLLEKYKLRSEWFFKDKLQDLYRSNSSAGENKLEEDLRLFLFEQGIDYPFSTPHSASGRADVVSMLHTDDPLVLEIKIYDERKGYKKNRISGGFSQIVKYANDYQKSVGYLVVFNFDPVNFEVQGTEPDKTWPNRVIFEGKIFYIIFINISNETSASKAGTIKKQVLTVEELTSSII